MGGGIFFLSFIFNIVILSEYRGEFSPHLFCFTLGMSLVDDEEAEAELLLLLRTMSLAPEA